MIRSLIIVMLLVGSFDCEAKEPFKIRWYMAHTPNNYFLNAAKVFSEVLYKETNGNVVVEAVIPQSITYTGAVRNRQQAFKKVLAGNYEMTQVYTDYLAEYDKRFLVFNMPYLFANHSEVTSVVESDWSKQLLAKLDDHGLVGLGFTYSGGFLGILTNGIQLAENGKMGKFKLRHFENQIGSDLYSAFGASKISANKKFNGVLLPLETMLEKGFVNSMELNLADASQVLPLNKMHLAKTLLKTKHQVWLTGLVINQKFFNKLPKKYKNAVRKAGRIAAISERKEIISSEMYIEEKMKKLGIRVVDLSQDQKLKSMSAGTWSKYSKIIGTKTVNKVTQIINRSNAKISMREQ